jgi:hypothetical protein
MINESVVDYEFVKEYLGDRKQRWAGRLVSVRYRLKDRIDLICDNTILLTLYPDGSILTWDVPLSSAEARNTFDKFIANLGYVLLIRTKTPTLMIDLTEPHDSWESAFQLGAYLPYRKVVLIGTKYEKLHIYQEEI